MTNLDELARLAREATPGPWYSHEPSEQAVWMDIKDRRYLIAATCHDLAGDGNAAYIAAANPETMLDLVGQCQAMKFTLTQIAAYDEPKAAAAAKQMLDKL